MLSKVSSVLATLAGQRVECWYQVAVMPEGCPTVLQILICALDFEYMNELAVDMSETIIYAYLPYNGTIKLKNFHRFKHLN